MLRGKRGRRTISFSASSSLTCSTLTMRHTSPPSSSLHFTSGKYGPISATNTLPEFETAEILSITRRVVTEWTPLNDLIRLPTRWMEKTPAGV